MSFTPKSSCGCSSSPARSSESDRGGYSIFRERSTFERELFELQASPSPKCSAGPTKCYDATKKSVPPAVGFEFDTTYGSSTSAPPPNDPDYSLDGCEITTHTTATDGFRCEGDGNRIEVKVQQVDLSAGKAALQAQMKKVLDFMKDLQTTCKSSAKNTVGAGSGTAKGTPHWFVPSTAAPGVASVFPISRGGASYYVDCDYEIAAAPQATITIPLSAVDNLVDEICRSEKKAAPGRAWSGGAGKREGVRSRALYEAQLAVNKSRNAHIKAGKTLSDKKTVVDATTFSRSLQGLLILIVSYLRVNFVPYDKRDYEQIAKSYLPLNVKNHFRLLFDDLGAAEKLVFRDLYEKNPVDLWKLAKRGATAADGNNELLVVDFARGSGRVTTRDHQKCYFDPIPRWKDFLASIASNKANVRTVDPKDARTKCGFGAVGEPYGKSGEGKGCEILFSPLSRVIEYEPKSLRVTLEMRRLGHGFVYPFPNKAKGRPGWLEMAEGIFDLTTRLNDPTLKPVKTYCAATWK